MKTGPSARRRAGSILALAFAFASLLAFAVNEGEHEPKKPPPKRPVPHTEPQHQHEISHPSGLRPGHTGASEQRRANLKAAGEQLAAAKAARASAARKLQLIEHQIQTLPDSFNRNDLFAQKRQAVKAHDVAAAALANAKHTFDLASNDYVVSHQKHSIQAPISGPPRGVRPLVVQGQEAERMPPEQAAANVRRLQHLPSAQPSQAAAASSSSSSQEPVAGPPQVESPAARARRIQQLPGAQAPQVAATASPAGQEPVAGAPPEPPAPRTHFVQPQPSAPPLEDRSTASTSNQDPRGQRLTEAQVAERAAAAAAARARRQAVTANAGAVLPGMAPQAAVPAGVVGRDLALARVVEAPRRAREPLNPLGGFPSTPTPRRALPTPGVFDAQRSREPAEPTLQELRGRASAIRAAKETPWAGTKGSVALDDSYSIEYESRGHLYGRPAAKYKQEWDAIPGEKPGFEDWCAELRAGKRTPAVDQLIKAGFAIPTEVTYLSKEEQARYKLQVKNGRIGIDKEDLNRGVDKPVVFVVGTDGQVYAGNYKRGEFHHSSLVAGGNTLGAGELYFDPAGKLTAISDKSGHYAPDRMRVLQGLDALAKSGVDLTDVDLVFTERPNDPREKAKAFYNRESWRISDGNFGQMDSAMAANVLKNRPDRSWILRQGAQFEGRISYKVNGVVQHVDLATVNLQAPGPRAVGSNPETQLDQAIAALGLVRSNMVHPAAAPVPATASGNAAVQHAR